MSQIPGWNSRLDELQAAILRVKLRHLDDDNRSRVRLGSQYERSLKELELKTPSARPTTSHVFHLYVIRSPQRDRLLTFLQEKDIGALIHYPVPIHLQPELDSHVDCDCFILQLLCSHLVTGVHLQLL